MDMGTMEMGFKQRTCRFKTNCVFCGRSSGKKLSYQTTTIELENELIIRGVVFYAIYSPLRNLAKAGFFVISFRMRHLIRLLHRVTDIHPSRRPLAFVKIEKNERSRNNSNGKERSRKNSDGKKNDNIVPKGFFPVYVGKDILTRFVLDVTVLNHPLFAELVEASLKEFGYEHEGALRIPWDVFLFKRIVNLINS